MHLPFGAFPGGLALEMPLHFMLIELVVISPLGEIS